MSEVEPLSASNFYPTNGPLASSSSPTKADSKPSGIFKSIQDNCHRRCVNNDHCYSLMVCAGLLGVIATVVGVVYQSNLSQIAKAGILLPLIGCTASSASCSYIEDRQEPYDWYADSINTAKKE